MPDHTGPPSGRTITASTGTGDRLPLSVDPHRPSGRTEARLVPRITTTRPLCGEEPMVTARCLPVRPPDLTRVWAATTPEHTARVGGQMHQHRREETAASAAPPVQDHPGGLHLSQPEPPQKLSTRTPILVVLRYGGVELSGRNAPFAASRVLPPDRRLAGRHQPRHRPGAGQRSRQTLHLDQTADELITKITRK